MLLFFISALASAGYMRYNECMKKITRDMTLEELVDLKDEAIDYLFKKDIRCILCGEPVLDTIEHAARIKKYSEEQIDGIIDDLNAL